MTKNPEIFKDVVTDKAIRLILEGTAADVGERFFRSLVENLVEVLGTTGAWVTEYVEDQRRLNALAFFLDGHWLDNFSYDISGTACEKVVVDKKLVHIPERLLELYKGNASLTELEAILRNQKAVSYLGVPLTDADDNVLGHLSVIDTRSIPSHPHIVNIFRIFANRASAELQRLNAEKRTRQNERKFRRLFDSTMDAIIEFDRNFVITRINPSGERLFKSSFRQISGRNLQKILARNDFAKTKSLIETLEKQSRERQNLFIPGGLVIRSVDEDAYPTEGTISKYEIDKNPYFALILRNEKDRIEAELKVKAMSVEAEYLKEEIRALGNYDDIIGQSEPLIQVLDKVRQVARTDATVLIYGETGTGKEAIARAIHAASDRSGKPLITVNCAAIPAALIESEFFGHEKGSFTGATTKRLGRFSLADKGSIFLDEIGELPVEMQAKLLRVLQEEEFEPLGAATSVKVDVRVIAATNRDLRKAIDEGVLRKDLYYRLNVFPIRLPPLRERGEDIVQLAHHFLQKFVRRIGCTAKTFSRDDISRLKSYHWPGNVRELQNVIERAVIISRGDRVDLGGLMPQEAVKRTPAPSPKTNWTLNRLLTEKDIMRIEKENLVAALETTGWRVSGKKGAARLLGMNPSTFASRMKRFKIDRPGN